MAGPTARGRSDSRRGSASGSRGYLGFVQYPWLHRLRAQGYREAFARTGAAAITRMLWRSRLAGVAWRANPERWRNRWMVLRRIHASGCHEPTFKTSVAGAGSRSGKVNLFWHGVRLCRRRVVLRRVALRAFWPTSRENRRPLPMEKGQNANVIAARRGGTGQTRSGRASTLSRLECDTA